MNDALPAPGPEPARKESGRGEEDKPIDPPVLRPIEGAREAHTAKAELDAHEGVQKALGLARKAAEQAREADQRANEAEKRAAEAEARAAKAEEGEEKIRAEVRAELK